MANAVITNNMLNCLKGYICNDLSYIITHPFTPTAFSNATNVDEGRNVITMSTGSLLNNIYTPSFTPAAQRLLRVTQLGQMKRDVRVLYWDNTLTQFSVDSYYPYFFTIKPTMLYNYTKASGLFSINTTYDYWIPFICEGTNVISQNTTDMNGDIIAGTSEVSVLDSWYNSDSFTVVYRISIPSTRATFNVNSVMLTGTGATSPSGHGYDNTSIPPIILAGTNLGNTIECEANDSVKITITYKNAYIAN